MDKPKPEKIVEALDPICCPRCKSKMLRVGLIAVQRKRGLSKPLIITERDSHPACQWEGRAVSITAEEATAILDRIRNKKVEDNFVEHFNNK